MLQSRLKLSSLRLELTGHFLRAFGDPPWIIIAGGRERSFGAKTLPKLGEWISQQQAAQRNVYAPLPQIGGHTSYLAIRAPFEIRPAECRFPPTITIVSDQYHLLWQCQEPMKPRLAKILSEHLAKDIGGIAAIDEPVPMPGTIMTRTVGARLQGRFPVQFLPPLPTAYRIINGQLVDVRPRAAVSPFIGAHQVEALPVRFLWPNVIALGTLTLLGGAAGAGKSTLAQSLAAILSSGGVWPTGEPSGRGSALVLEAEEDAERTTVPRLMAAGADLTRIGLGKALNLSESLDHLESEAKRRSDLRLVILSPIRMFFGDAENRGVLGVRDAMAPLLAWAERRGVAVIGICHPLKGEEKKESFAGSPAFYEVARAAFSLIPDPKDKNPIMKLRRRIMATAKNNLGDDRLVLRYRLEGARAGEIETSKVVWE